MRFSGAHTILEIVAKEWWEDITQACHVMKLMAVDVMYSIYFIFFSPHSEFMIWMSNNVAMDVCIIMQKRKLFRYLEKRVYSAIIQRLECLIFLYQEKSYVHFQNRFRVIAHISNVLHIHFPTLDCYSCLFHKVGSTWWL